MSKAAISKATKVLATLVTASDEAARRLRELAVADVDHAWGTLKKLTHMEEFPSIRLAAATAMLAYAAPPPEVAEPAAAAQANKRPIDLSRYTVEELQAIKTLQAAQQRIVREDEEK